MAFPSAAVKAGNSWRVWFSCAPTRRNRAWPQYYRDKECGLECTPPRPHRPSLLLCEEEQRLRLSEIHITSSHHPQAPGQGFTPTFILSGRGLGAKVSGTSLSPSEHTTECPRRVRGRSAEGKDRGWAEGGCRRVGGRAQQLRIPGRNHTGRKQETCCRLFSGFHFKSWESPVFIKRKGKKPPFMPSGIREKIKVRKL